MKKTIVWADGCFDMFHYGHANALRQSRQLGNKLIAGIHSNKSILENKGLPVMEDDERIEMVSSCRYVDEVVIDAPFVTQVDLIRKYNVDIVAHGDDLIFSNNGEDAYHQVKNNNMFREVKRTHGISTTEIVGRILLKQSLENAFKQKITNECHTEYQNDLIKTFKQDLDNNKKNKEIVFTDGNYDLLHAGHANALKSAKSMGNYLIVGVHEDSVVKQYNKNRSILDINERILGLLACKYVDEVVISPYLISNDFINSLGATKIVPSYDVRDNYRYNNVKDLISYDFKSNNFSYLSSEYITGKILTNYQQFLCRQKKRLEIK